MTEIDLIVSDLTRKGADAFAKGREKLLESISARQYVDEARRGFPKVTLPTFKFMEKPLEDE